MNDHRRQTDPARCHERHIGSRPKRPGAARLVLLLLLPTAMVAWLAMNPPLTASAERETDAPQARPAGGDPDAESWTVINRRWVRNTYPGGAVTLTDRETGLMWVADAKRIGRHPWAKAKKVCADLAFAGYDDWRLPSRGELAAVAPHDEHFVNVQDAWYWSSTPSETVFQYTHVVGLGDDAQSTRYGGHNLLRLPGLMQDRAYVYSYHVGNRYWVLPRREIKP